MRTFFKTVFVLALVSALVMLAFGLGLFALLGDLSDLHIRINGDDLVWSGLDLGDVIGAGIGLLVAAVVVCVVVPLALLLGLGLPLLIFGGLLVAGVMAVLGIGALLGSPLILIGLVLWLLLRDKPRQPRAAPPQANPLGAPPAAR